MLSFAYSRLESPQTCFVKGKEYPRQKARDLIFRSLETSLVIKDHDKATVAHPMKCYVCDCVHVFTEFEKHQKPKKYRKNVFCRKHNVCADFPINEKIWNECYAHLK